MKLLNEIRAVEAEGWKRWPSDMPLDPDCEMFEYIDIGGTVYYRKKIRK